MLENVFIKNLAGYQSYHLNPHNQLTHFFGIPMIVISVIWISTWLPLGLEYLVFFGFIALWLAMDLVIGAILGLIFLPFFLIGLNWFQGLYETNFWLGLGIFAVLFVVGWIIQIVGHIFEGRKPALMDNLFQGLLGPMFLVYEFFVHTGQRQALQRKVENELADLIA